MAKKLTIENDTYERKAWLNGEFLCGIDEVGRGCLAGPLVAGAVILHPGKTHDLLKDSKILTQEEREAVFPWIIQNSWFSYSFTQEDCIDRINIYNATKKAMKRSILQVIAHAGFIPEKAIIDAVSVKFDGKIGQNCEFKAFPYAEEQSITVAAASIVAKIVRDRLMEQFDTIIPGFNLGLHKGYGTPDHQKALNHQGRSVVHRVSFLKKSNERRVEYLYGKQKSLFG